MEHTTLYCTRCPLLLSHGVLCRRQPCVSAAVQLSAQRVYPGVCGVYWGYQGYAGIPRSVCMVDIVPHGRWLPGSASMCSGAHSANVAGSHWKVGASAKNTSIRRNKLASLKAMLVQNYDPATYSQGSSVELLALVKSIIFSKKDQQAGPNMIEIC